MRPSYVRLLFALSLSLSAAACGSGGNAGKDASSEPDAGPIDTGAPRPDAGQIFPDALPAPDATAPDLGEIDSGAADSGAGDMDAQAAPDATEADAQGAPDAMDSDAQVGDTGQIDTTPPTMAIVRPANRRLYYGGSTTVEVSIVDPSGTGDADFTIDGMLVQTVTSAPYRITLDTFALADGPHDVVVRGFDTQSNTSSVAFTLNVDNTPPSMQVPSTAEGATLTGTVLITVTAVDPAGIARVSSGAFSSGSSPLNYMFNTRTLPNGPYEILGTSRDRTIVNDAPSSGNSSSTSVNVVIFNTENQPPVVTFVNPLDQDSVYRNVNIQVNATAFGSATISRVGFTADGVTIGTDSTAPYSIALPLSAYSGILTLTATAVTNNGIRGSATIQVEVTAPPNFVIPERYRPVGTISSGSHLAIGDLNVDGQPDAVVSAGTSISLFLGTASGAFAAPTSFGSSSSQVAIGDLNADGQPDIVARNANNLNIYRNQGNATFNVSTLIALGMISPGPIAAGDLSGDGRDDLVVGRGSGGDMVVYIQGANGTFASPVSYGATGGVVDLELADVDNNGSLDIVIGRSGGANHVLTVYRNSGLGTFGAGQDTFVPGAPDHVRVGRINDDSAPDIVATSDDCSPPTPAYACMFVLLGDPQALGAFPGVDAQSSIRGAANSLRLMDVDGDADLDIVYASADLNGAQAIINESTGSTLLLSFGRRYILARDATDLAGADVDSDGVQDLLALGPADGSVVVARGLGGGRFYAAPDTHLPQPGGAITTGNVVAGGQPEVAVAMDAVTGMLPLPPAVAFYAASGDQFLGAGSVPLDTHVTPPTSIAIGDLQDRSGGSDIAVGSDVAAGMQATINAELLLATGAPGIYTHSPISVLDRPVSVTIAPVANTGLDQAIFAVRGALCGARIFNGAGSQVDLLSVGSATANTSGVAVGDLDGDSVVDVVVANPGTSNVTLFRADGTGGFLPPENFNALTAMAGVAIGPINRDSANDLIGIGSTVSLLTANATFRFDSPTTWPVGSGAITRRIITGDYNHDGYADVVVLLSSDQAVYLLGRAQGGFFPAESIAVGPAPSDLATADLDGDGLLDIVVSHRGVSGFTTLFGAP